VSRLSTDSPAKKNEARRERFHGPRVQPAECGRRVIDMILPAWAICRYPVEYGVACRPQNGAPKKRGRKGANPLSLGSFIRAGAALAPDDRIPQLCCAVVAIIARFRSL
jgi:hypothetical protein